MYASTGVGVSGILVFAILVGLVMTVYWLWCLIDCLGRTFPGPNDKVVWVLVIVLLGFLGAVVYQVAGRPKARTIRPYARRRVRPRRRYPARR